MPTTRGYCPLISRFAAVGIAATLVYAALALALASALGGVVSQPSLSLLAYILAACFSYCAHRAFTFASLGSHRFEVPRFASVTAMGAGISFLVPVLLGRWTDLPIAVPVAAVCVIVPLLNFVALDRWVFTRRKAVSGGEYP
jgi:putative flippase GtrA